MFVFVLVLVVPEGVGGSLMLLGLSVVVVVVVRRSVCWSYRSSTIALSVYRLHACLAHLLGDFFRDARRFGAACRHAAKLVYEG